MFERTTQDSRIGICACPLTEQPVIGSSCSAADVVWPLQLSSFCQMPYRELARGNGLHCPGPFCLSRVRVAHTKAGAA